MHNGIWYLYLNGNGGWDDMQDCCYLLLRVAGCLWHYPWLEIGPELSVTKIGVFHNGVWYFDLNGNGAWDGTPTDGLYYLGGGLTGAVPVTGDWTGTGSAKIGVYAEGVWYFDLNGNGAWDGTRWMVSITSGVVYERTGDRRLDGYGVTQGSGCMRRGFGISI